jgi:hypothetical protein
LTNEKLTTHEIDNLLLSTDNKGRTVWHWAAQWGNSETSQQLREWANEKLTTDEINNLLLSTDYKGRTV